MDSAQLPLIVLEEGKPQYAEKEGSAAYRHFSRDTHFRTIEEKWRDDACILMIETINLCKSMIFERNDPSHVLDLEGSSVFLIQVIRRYEEKNILLVREKVDLLLGSFRHEDADDRPSSPIEEAGSKYVERSESLRIVIIENGHELFHALLRNIIRFSHFPPVVDHTQLIGFYIVNFLLACSASFTPFSIM